jgi:anti-anti-sigma regulatory factor
MTIEAMYFKLDPASAVHTLQHEALEKVSGAEGEVVLDFGEMARIDTSTVRALEDLADLADKRSVSVMLRGVNVPVYKVLKVLKLTTRFSFPG